MFETIHTHTIYAPPLDSDSVVLDLGAHCGEFAKKMSARYGGTYYLVEANPVLAEALRVEGSFPVWHCAVADTEGPIHFHIAHNDTGSSILNPGGAAVMGRHICIAHNDTGSSILNLPLE